MQSRDLSEYYSQFEEPQDFLCPLCLKLVREPVEKLCCSQLFCAECYKQYGNQLCPCCRQFGDLRPVKGRIRDLLNNVDCKCPSCLKLIKYGDIPNHFLSSECEYQPPKAEIKNIIVNLNMCFIGQQIIIGSYLYSLVSGAHGIQSTQTATIIAINITTGQHYIHTEPIQYATWTLSNIQLYKYQKQAVAIECFGVDNYHDRCGYAVIKARRHQDNRVSLDVFKTTYRCYKCKQSSFSVGDCECRAWVEPIIPTYEFKFENIEGRYNSEQSIWVINQVPIFGKHYVGHINNSLIFVDKNHPQLSIHIMNIKV